MRKTLTPVRTVVAALALVAWAVPCLAAEHAEGGESASSQLLKPDYVVAGATIAVFVLLLVVLKKTAWKPILAGLKARADAIRASVEGAERAAAEAKALLADHRKKVDAAADEARSIVEEGRKDAEALRSRIHADAAQEASKERDRAVRDIELAKDAALKELHERVAVLATDVAGRILQAKLDPAQHRRLVDEAVASYESERRRKAPGSRA